MICTYVTLQAPFLPVDLSQSGKELNGTSGGLVPLIAGLTWKLYQTAQGFFQCVENFQRWRSTTSPVLRLHYSGEEIPG